ncbi:phage major capsid protein, P2 family [Aeromonas hydrophila]|uniref:phage major capsid protein, P2 family n=1 Tax=Aeromonas hydrophila TaxID=644 RepID=UPI000872F70F|nr:phage major capsid protein, P2 family [Aeromonas hydrophila]OFC51445.1 phage major capsid protein, P2 family [Aeromonas hydrophila]
MTPVALTPRARERITKYFATLGATFKVPDFAPGELFSITDPVETLFRDALLESDAFLKLIGVHDVEQVKGQTVQTGIGGIYTGRTKGGRFKKSLGVDGNTYELVSTDSCASLDWATLCTWANAGSEGEFVRRMNEFVTKAFGLDMLRTGWNGIEAADTTDPVANPLGEDINKGWIQLAREWNGGSQIVTADAGDKLYFDPDGAGDFATLDAMASDLINSTIHPAFRTDKRLVVLCGAELMAAAQHRLYSEATKPSEQRAAQELANSIAGRTAYVPPFFPATGMVVTLLENLHIYTQRGTRQRSAKNNQDTLSFDNQYWRMEGYAIPEYEAFAGYEPADIEIGARPEMPPAPGE